MNISDGEKIATLLQRQGHTPTKNEADADLIVLNCCSVRQAAVHRVYDKINKYTGKKKLILAGCVLEKDKNALKGGEEKEHPKAARERRQQVRRDLGSRIRSYDL